MSPATNLSEIADVLLRSHFEDWEVERSDGYVEAFDPLTLFSSLIESEIELNHALAIFDKVITNIDLITRDSGGTEERKFKISHANMHEIVSGTLLDYPHPHAPFWLSNYENIFSKDLYAIDHDQEDYIDAKNASALRSEIVRFLGENQYVGGRANQDISNITNRLIKLIRFCGFYQVERKFLQTFLQALSTSSTKAFVPQINISDQEFLGNLERIEGLLLALRELPDGKPNFASTTLNSLSAAVLSWLGVIYTPNSPSLLKQVRDVLSFAFKKSSASSGARALEGAVIPHYRVPVWTHLKSGLDRARIAPETLVAMIDTIEGSLAQKAINEAATWAERLIRLFRLLADDDGFLQNLRRYDEGDPSDEKYVKLIVDRISAEGYEIISKSDKKFEIRINHQFHKIVDYGASIEFIAALSCSREELDGFDVSSDIFDGSGSGKLYCIVVEKDTGGAFRENVIAEIQRSRKFISVIRRDQLEKVLFRSGDVRTVVLEQFFRIYPSAMEWQRDEVFKIDKAMLPEGLRLHDLKKFENYLRSIEHDLETTTTLNAFSLLESRLRSHVLFICSIDPEKNLQDFYDRGGGAWTSFGGMLGFLNRLAQNKNKIPKLIHNLLFTVDQLRELDSIREHRNKEAHNEIEIEKNLAQNLTIQVAKFISLIDKKSNSFVKFIIDKNLNFIYYYDTQEEKITSSSKIDNGMKIGFSRTNTQADAVIFGYSPRNSPGQGYHALARCTECQSVIHLSSQLLATKYTCSSCRRKSQFVGDWGGFVQKCLSHNRPSSRYETKTIEGMKGSNMPEGKAADWLRSLGEGLVAALGPAGAPLKVILHRLDRKDLDTVQEKIDMILRRPEVNKEDILSAMVSLKLDEKIGKIISMNILEKVNYIRNLSNKVEQLRGDFVSVSNVSESDFVDELCRLYPDFELLTSDLRRGGLEISRVRKTGTARVDIESYVSALRGMDLEKLENIVQVLAKNNSGSKIVSEIQRQIADTARIISD